MRAASPVKEVRHIGLMGEDLASFLNTQRTLERPQFEALERALRMIVPSVTGIDVQVNNLGEVELYLGIPPPESPSLILNVVPEFWIGLGVIVAVLIAMTGFIFEPDFGWLVLSVFAGGLEMVFGYFLYEFFVLVGPGAIAEVPVNIGQMSIGLIVAIPVVRVVWRYLPDLRRAI